LATHPLVPKARIHKVVDDAPGIQSANQSAHGGIRRLSDSNVTQTVSSRIERDRPESLHRRHSTSSRPCR
jgi:hypothetical protein